MPFLLNALYEIQQEGKRKVVFLPKKVTSQNALRDIYAGYLGSLWGLGMSHLAQPYSIMSSKYQTAFKQSLLPSFL